MEINAALIISAGALFLSALTFWRTGRWREAETLKLLVDKVSEQDTRLVAVETKLLNLATKADIASVQSEVRALEKTVDKVDAGVIRIERILMENER